MTYHVGRGAEQLGQFSTEQIRAGLSSGQFFESDLVWCEGMSGWQPLGETLQLESGQNSESVSEGSSDSQPKAFTFSEGGGAALPSSSPAATTAGSYSSQQALPPAHVGVGVMPVPGSAIASLVLGLIPVLFCVIAPITGIVGVVLGHAALRHMKASTVQYDGRGLAVAGLILNYVWLALSILAIVLFVVFLLIGASVANAESGGITI